MKVKFIKAYTVKAPAPKNKSYTEGQVVDFAKETGDPESGRRSAMHFVNKGVAEPTDEAVTPVKEAVKPEAVKTEPVKAEPPKKEEDKPLFHNKGK